jgi:hypothetical protein
MKMLFEMYYKPHFEGEVNRKTEGKIRETLPTFTQQYECI